MRNCTSVVSLPSSFWRLSNLKKLDLSAERELFPMKLKSLPERFGHLKSLVELNLKCCHSLRELPAGELR